VTGHVFISYRHEEPDQSYVERLAAFLTGAEVAVWFDREIVSGDRWHALIQQKINDCGAFIVVMTPAADASPWVNREIAEAEQAGKPIYPLLLLGRAFFRLGDLQYDDVTDGQLPSRGFVTRLQRHGSVTRSNPPPAPAPATPASLGPKEQAPKGPAVGGQLRVEHMLSGIAHTDAVRCLAFSPDGQVLASGGHDGAIRLWSGTTGEHLHTHHVGDSFGYESLDGDPDSVTAVAFSPDGRTLAAAGEGGVWLWPDAGRHGTRRDLGGYGITALVFHPDSQWLVATSVDGGIRPVDRRHSVQRVAIHLGGGTCLSLHAETMMLASGSVDGAIVLSWPDRDEIPVVLAGHTGPVRAVCFLLEPSVAAQFGVAGPILASGGDDGAVRLWDASSGDLLRTLARHEDGALALAATRDGLLASAAGDGQIRVWTPAQLSERRVGDPAVAFSLPPWPTCMAFGARRLAVGGYDKSIHLCFIGTSAEPATAQAAVR
jgi:WD40 repeat protein